ncbi:MAG TPA: hypothetical protein VJV05_14590 [Pyrinomonadaceae bacterium]|nr:hypothetical protein [Pyrinomonadaceae bacterium]
MKGKALFLSCVAVVFFLSSTVSGQGPTRIKFRKGAVKADVSGTLNSFNSIRRYVIRVRSGQTISTEQIGGEGRPITISLTGPNDEDAGDSDASCNNRREIAPTKAGDYHIEVIECRKAEPWRGRFTFRVTVR